MRPVGKAGQDMGVGSAIQSVRMRHHRIDPGTQLPTLAVGAKAP